MSAVEMSTVQAVLIRKILEAVAANDGAVIIDGEINACNHCGEHPPHAKDCIAVLAKRVLLDLED